MGDRVRFIAGLFAAAAGVTSFCWSADDQWPQWRGPRRDGISGETGLLKQWPEGGPKLLWTAAGCGKGYSSVAVADRTIYTAGTSDGQTFVIALDDSGKLKWRSPNGKSWAAPEKMTWAQRYDGARATPTVSDGLVCHLGDLGQLTAFDAASGKPVWSVDIAGQFDAQTPKYGYTESVLVDGDRVICSPAGKKGHMVALKKKTGDFVWACTDVADEAGCASAILVEDRGVRQVVTMTADNLIGVDADSGKLLWRHPFTNKRKNNIPTPIYRDGFVYASTGYGSGSVCLKLAFDGKSVSAAQAWAGNDLDNIHGGILLVDGFLYGSANEKPGWVCLDAKTGVPRYAEKGVGMGSVTCADGMLYCLGEAGTMALVPCTPERHQAVSSFDVPKGGDGKHWAHPVVCGGRLHVRHADCLYAYDIRAK